LALFSLVFYAWGEPIWVSLLLVSCVVDYLNGLFIDYYKNSPSIARAGLVSSLVVNLGLLGTFKYSDFIIQNINSLLGTQFQQPGFLLPIGISF
jgi:alginate O-acetyltransferase complex protein AlgI